LGTEKPASSRRLRLSERLCGLLLPKLVLWLSESCGLLRLTLAESTESRVLLRLSEQSSLCAAPSKAGLLAEGLTGLHAHASRGSVLVLDLSDEAVLILILLKLHLCLPLWIFLRLISGLCLLVVETKHHL